MDIIQSQIARRTYYTKLGETTFTSQKVVKEFFNKLVKTKGEIILQHRGEARVAVVTADKTFDRFVKVHETIEHYGEFIKLSTTINYSEIMNHDVKITTKEGVLEEIDIK